MRARRESLAACLAIAATVGGCANGGALPSAQSVGQASALPSAANIQPIEGGRLESGVRYTLPTDPVLSVAPGDGWGAAIVPGGVQLINGQSVVRIISGFDEAYVGMGALEQAGSTAEGIFDQLLRNQRVATGESGTAEFGGLTADYLDANAIYELNEEGGANILSTANAPLRLSDLFVNRVFVIEEGTSPIVVVASGPESAGIAEALELADPVLSSIRVEGR